MKISELNTKSFLGGTGAAENSYVLINYEDNSTSEPVTYKASLQELGKAIANDLKLPSVTVNGNAITNFKVKGVSNGAYTETAVGVLQNDGPSMGDVNVAVNTAISGLASTGYVTNAISTATNGLLDINDVRSLFINDSIATTVDINVAVDGLASTGYVDGAISGLASTGYVTAAVANAGGGGFNPAEPVICSVGRYTANDSYVSEGTDSLYPVMIAHYSGAALYIQSQTDAGKFIYSGIIASESDLNGMACISTSDNKPCIRNRDQEFIGFLSTT